MSKLSLKNQQGSVLVAAVVFGIVLSLGGGSLIMVGASTVNDEIVALENEKALRATESALQIAVRYLRIQGNFPPADNATIVSAMVINGISVDVVADVDGDDVTLTSTGTSSYMPYSKSVSWVLSDPAAGSGTFVNFIEPSSGGNGVGGGGFNNVVIDGPFHTNQSIVISSVANGESAVAFYNGLVTAHNETGEYNFNHTDPFEYIDDDVEDWGNYGSLRNDYEFGIFKYNQMGDFKADKLDEHFTDEFEHSQNYRFVEDYYTEDILLDAGDVDAVDDDEIGYRPTLVFQDDGSIDYYKWTHSGSDWIPDSTKLEAADVDGKLIRVPGADVNVIGTVDGKISVMTDEGHSIFPVGDLVMEGFSAVDESEYDGYDNSNNYGIAMDNENTIGLISGKDVFFINEWYDPRNGTNPGGSPIGGTQWVQANMVAAYSGGTHKFVLNPGVGQQNVNLSAYDGDYDLRFIGSRTIDEWFNYTSGGANANEAIRFFHDKRYSQGDIAPPSMPEIKSTSTNGDTLINLKFSNWTETNI